MLGFENELLSRCTLAIQIRGYLNFRRLCYFLESLYIELETGMGCLRESPKVESNVCYTNTNYLALQALKLCGSSLVKPIRRFLKKYDHERSGRFEVLWLEPIPYPPHYVKTITLNCVETSRECIEVKASLPGGFLPDWSDYADLLMLAALEKLRRGDKSRAIALRNRVLSMWDGKGFADKVYMKGKLYETYKLSLYYFLARALKLEDGVYRKIPKIIGKMVSREGGIRTHYDVDLKPGGDPNVETTSVTILAFYSSYPEGFSAGEENNGNRTFTLIRWLTMPATLAILALSAWRWWWRLLSSQRRSNGSK